MNDDEAIAEAEEAAKTDDKPKHWFTASVNVEIDIANIICALLLPPVVGAIVLAILTS